MTETRYDAGRIALLAAAILLGTSIYTAASAVAEHAFGVPSPESFIVLLAQYGPMALIVFMVFVVLSKANATEDPRVRLVAQRCTWISIFLLTAVIVIFWLLHPPPRKEYVAEGVIRNLRDPEMITTNEEMYLHFHHIFKKDFEYVWRLITPEPFVGKLELMLQKTPTDREALIYAIPVSSDFYKGR